MRRGHQGFGGWQNENQRQFRPRGGGPSHYRFSRGYRHLDQIRYPPPGPRPFLSAPPYRHQGPPPDNPEHYERNKYRSSNRYNPQRTYEKSNYGDGQMNALYHRVRHVDAPAHNPFNETPKYCDDKNQDKDFHINSMGDIDDRQPVYRPRQREFNISPWANTVPYCEESPTKSYKHRDSGDLNIMPVHTGHRPPSSDHYGGNSGSATDNSNTFSKSVDDTVNIVRKRLLNRESQHMSDNPPTGLKDIGNQAQQTTSSFTNIQQEQPMKKRVQKQRPEVKSNCDKIKDKIVHQLFMMDKEKIHKLMDNPKSSDKFEYAISSLITESQNSYNRHLRSVAEKSLCSSSTEFIHNDRNTIYEDTFMKQMQCILDPQDTVLLEDIKPMVLAELCKVLQLHDFDQMVDDPTPHPSLDEPPRFDDFSNPFYENYPTFSSQNDTGSYFEPNSPLTDVDRLEKPLFKSELKQNYPAFSPQTDSGSYFEPNPPLTDVDRSEKSLFQSETQQNYPAYSPQNDSGSYFEQNPPTDVVRSEKPSFKSELKQSCGNNIEVQYHPTPLFERRQTKKFDDYSSCDRNTTSDIDRRRQERRSIDKKSSEHEFRKSPIPLFDSNTDQLSEEEDPFAELDRQYHVAVDHSFIASDDLSCQQPAVNNRPIIQKDVTKTPQKNTSDNVQEPDKMFYDTKNSDAKPYNIKTPNITPYKIEKENVTKSLDIARSHLKFAATLSNKKNKLEHKISKTLNDKIYIKQECMTDSNISTNSASINQEDSVERNVLNKPNVKQQQQQTPDPKAVHEPTVTSENSSSMIKSSVSSSNTRKRSIDQRPSHRKEKRKKFESSPSETNKQILNKNIIINVNDCAGKSKEKCDTKKSIFNLFFAKENEDKESNKGDCAEKGYSDKYVKRKENLKKQRESEAKKKHDSISSSHSNVSPSDSSSTSISCQTSSKTDGKPKLKSIDIFGEQPQKTSSLYHSHRNTATALPSANKTTVGVNCKPVLQISRKLIRRHTGSQYDIVKPTKETQTERHCNSRFVQTERKKLVARGVQTGLISKSKLSDANDPHSKGVFVPQSKSTDTIERMKEIDMEIQVLLQEKFKLYSSMESKESCVNTMQSLGMAVLNVSPFDDASQDEASMDTLSEESIVEDFANIPVEEIKKFAMESVREETRKLALEGDQEGDQKFSFESIQEECRQLAIESNQDDNQKPTPKRIRKSNRKWDLESVQENNQMSALGIERDSPRHKSVKRASKTSTSIVKKKTKPPNISLIEQIITDDRPLEDIISLDYLESPPPVKVKKKKSHKRSQQKPKKKESIKVKTTKKKYDLSQYCMRESYVLLLREDLSKYTRLKSEALTVIEASEAPEAGPEPDNNVVEDPVINDIQFDMLDVSEDIVIGDLCEVKTEDKGANYMSSVTIAEEIILDNSQSSMEDVGGSDVAPSSNECKMYDYSANENLRRDSLTVVGNGDAVLAIECIENQFIAACLDGNVYHFSVDGQLLNTLRGSNLAVTCLTIVKEKYGTTVYTGSLDSRIRYYDLETGLEKGPECNVLSPIQTMDRAWDTIFVGTRTGFVLQFECKNNMLIPVSTVKFSDQSILALRAMKEGPRKVLLVAARSEAVTIKDAQTGLLLRTLEGPKMTVYTILFEDGKVYCGTSSHNIHVFDYTSGSPVGFHEGGKGAVCLRSAGGLLFAGCYDGCVYVFREGEGRPLAQLRGPSLMLLSLAIVGTKIIAGYKDRSLYIWKIPISIQQEMIL